MITSTTAWNTANAAAGKMPIYAFSIAGQAVVYVTHDLARWGITGTLPTYQAWLKTPRGASQAIDVVNGSSSIGDLTCEILDVGHAITALIAAQNLEGSTATLAVGYPGLAWTDFAVLHTYVLYKINPTDGYTSYHFVCRDLQLLEKQTIYAHPENGEILAADNPWYLGGTPCEIFQAITLYALHVGLAQIDRATMVTLDSAAEGIFAPWRPFLFCLTRPFEAKQWLESEVFKPSGLYQVVLPSGQLSLRSMRAPAAGASAAFAFTADNLVELPKWDRMPVVNQAIWQFDDDGGGNYQNYETFLQATSISQYGRGNQFSVNSAGLRTEYGAFAYAEWVTSRLFRRFSGVAPAIKGGAIVLTVRSMLMTLPVWVGDYATCAHPLMPDVTTGTVGTTRIYEVIERQPDYASGQMAYKLLDTGLTGQAPAYEWGASSARPFLIGGSAVY